jgi:hypothetical protein
MTTRALDPRRIATSPLASLACRVTRASKRYFSARTIITWFASILTDCDLFHDILVTWFR